MSKRKRTPEEIIDEIREGEMVKVASSIFGKACHMPENMGFKATFYEWLVTGMTDGIAGRHRSYISPSQAVSNGTRALAQ